MATKKYNKAKSERKKQAKHRANLIKAMNKKTKNSPAYKAAKKKVEDREKLMKAQEVIMKAEKGSGTIVEGSEDDKPKKPVRPGFKPGGKRDPEEGGKGYITGGAGNKKENKIIDSDPEGTIDDDDTNGGGTNDVDEDTRDDYGDPDSWDYPSTVEESIWSDDQYDFQDWLEGQEGGLELNQYDPKGTEWTGGPNLIPKGKYGMQRGPTNYLERRGIGHNLAYKPWMKAAWGPSPDPDEPYRGVPGSQWTKYRELQRRQGRIAPLDPETGKPVEDWERPLGEPGADIVEGETRLPRSRVPTGYVNPVREGLFHYGGKMRTDELDPVTGRPIYRATPMHVPGGWKPQVPTGPRSNAPPVYPIARTDLWQGGMSRPGPLPKYTAVKPVTEKDDPDDNKGGTITGNAQRGTIWSDYTGHMGNIKGAVDSLFRITGKAVEARYGGTGSNTYDTWKVPLTLYGDGGPRATHAYRVSSKGGWDPSMNTWNIPGAGGGSDGGISPISGLTFADWVGNTPTAQFSTPTGTSFLGGPVNTREIERVTPTYLHKDFGGTFESTTPGAFGTGFLSNWALPETYGELGYESDQGSLIGYDNPIYTSS